MIASCAFDLKFHDWESCACLGGFQPNDSKKSGFVDIAWSKEGKHLVAVPSSGKCSLFKPQPIPHKRETNINKETIDVPSVKCASFSKLESQYVALGTTSGHIILYSVAHKKALQLFEELPASINYIEYGARDSYLAAGSSSGQIFLYEGEFGVTSTYCVPASNSLTVLRTHPVLPEHLGGGSETGTVAIWDTRTSDCVYRANNQGAALVDMAFSHSDDTFITVGSDKAVVIYDRRVAECVHRKMFDLNFTALAYCPNGNDVLLGNSRGHIICLDRRYLNASRSGLIAHNSPVKKIRFQFPCNAPRPDCNAADEEEAAKPESGDTMNQLAAENAEKILRGAPRASKGTGDFTVFHIIDDNHLMQLRQEIVSVAEEMMNTILESVNAEFLKLRMEISRQFCGAESMSKANLYHVQQYITKLAATLDDDQNELERKTELMSQFESHFKSLEQFIEEVQDEEPNLTLENNVMRTSQISSNRR